MAYIPALLTVYDRALSCSSRLSEHSALSPEYKSLSDEALGDLRQVGQAISDLQLFSKNETLEDVSTKQLVYLTVPYATAELLLALPSAEPAIRKDILGQAESQLQKFITYLIDYEIVDDAMVQATKRAVQMSKNPAQRRDAKIQQYQAEKQLKSRIQTLRSQTLATNIEESSNNYDSIRMLISTGGSHAGSVNADDDDLDMDDETRRELSLVLLRLLYAQAHTSLQQIEDEVQILRSMPPQPPSGSSQSELNKPGDDTWRLDMTPRGGLDGKGPLMDPQGRPLRPFTILPSNVAERTRLQKEVFQPDHRLPTMTIDEYLAEEQRQGNILRGGGKASEEAPTSSEQLTVDSEQDGTRFGEEKSEEKHRKDEEWAAYTDANPKGAGNTMNRG
ncbi:serine/threonine protein phosphatase PP2A-associated protein [Rhizoctonia solani]|nr:serine/threonine protein phosphatase PP2A-associated protein [Rhizoctonia solani]